ncbi:MAG: hypothetical protein J6Z11_08125, partial [Candidatus Riflebacteria bacterium]|nr:hypothetical protein [Candidatus Riflebacteria bacterium]
MAKDFSKMNKETLQEQYDECVKKLLSEKYILAWILKECTTEFKPFEIEKIVKEAFIDEIKISKVAVNQDEDDIEEPTRIDTSNSEDNSRKNGPIIYDIRFNVVVPDSDIPVALIINIEAQKTSETPYPLLKRALYYCNRLISSQKNVVFVKSHYEKLRKVYSIWIQMNTSKKKQNTMNRYKVIEENLVGQYKDNSINYDLLNIITIGLGKVEDTEPKTILNMLDTLLYSNKPSKEKLDTLKNLYNITISDSIIEEINTMCNLGEGLYEKAYNQAVADEQAKQAIAMQKLLEEKTKA